MPGDSPSSNTGPVALNGIRRVTFATSSNFERHAAVEQALKHVVGLTLAVKYNPGRVAAPAAGAGDAKQLVDRDEVEQGNPAKARDHIHNRQAGAGGGSARVHAAL